MQNENIPVKGRYNSSYKYAKRNLKNIFCNGENKDCNVSNSKHI